MFHCNTFRVRNLRHWELVFMWQPCCMDSFQRYTGSVYQVNLDIKEPSRCRQMHTYPRTDTLSAAKRCRQSDRETYRQMRGNAIIIRPSQTHTLGFLRRFIIGVGSHVLPQTVGHLRYRGIRLRLLHLRLSRAMFSGSLRFRRARASMVARSRRGRALLLASSRTLLHEETTRGELLCCRRGHRRRCSSCCRCWCGNGRWRRRGSYFFSSRQSSLLQQDVDGSIPLSHFEDRVGRRFGNYRISLIKNSRFSSAKNFAPNKN